MLAYVTSSIPAALEPNGSLQPLIQHVLAWVAYGKHLPFNTADASGPLGPQRITPKPSCSFVGQSVIAWDATSGKQILDGGFVPADGTP